ncbi:hypothetical protein F5B20DRAFT_534318 [Whalleya microplaca]|nr:hypothetical protein F5B20DRAFT_534318 [Whalleya microplaca]
MEPQLVLKLKDDDTWVVAKTAFDIIAAYVQPTSQSLPEQVALYLDNLTPVKRQLNYLERTETFTSFLLEFWEVFLVLARQIPCDHPSQARLVQLVAELKSLSTMSAETGRGIWTDLVGLENSIQDSWKEPSSAEDTFEPFQEWINLNAFVSRLYGDGLIDFYYFAIWTMRDSLEIASHPVEDVFECYVTAAAQWIYHSSSTLLKDMRDREPRELELGPLRSSLFVGTKVISIDRWLFWKQRFKSLSELDSPEILKREALAAFEVMHRDDGEVPYVH